MTESPIEVTPEPRLDHLVYAVPDLEAGIDSLEGRLGTRALPGGEHPAHGTRNAILSLGPGCYLEIIAPAAHRPSPPRERVFGLDEIHAPRLATWVARAHPLEPIVERAREAGADLGSVFEGHRVSPEGDVVSWRVTDPYARRDEGVLPFFIDWGETIHPSIRAPVAGALAELSVEHPEPERIERLLEVLGVPLVVKSGERPRLVAWIDVGSDRVELR